MKSFVFTGLILTAMVATGAEHSSQSTPALSQHLTHKQAVRMVDTACTPEEHRELAQYFRQEAQQKRKKEQYYREVAATYRLHPPRVDAYRNASTADLYAHLANEAWDEALADDRIAQLQDQFAGDLAKSTK
jgi:hypothetical protein